MKTKFTPCQNTSTKTLLLSFHATPAVLRRGATPHPASVSSVVCRAIRVSLICGKLKIFLISEPTPHSQPDNHTQILVASLLPLHHLTGRRSRKPGNHPGGFSRFSTKKEVPSFIFFLTVNFRKTIPSLAAMKRVAEAMSNH